MTSVIRLIGILLTLKVENASAGSGEENEVTA